MPAYLGLCRSRLISRIRKKGSATITFLVSELSQWKYQSLFDILSKDNRFELKVLLVPFPSSARTQEDSLCKLREYFTSKCIDYLDFESYSSTSDSLKKDIDPDLIFYPQPYENCYDPCLDSKVFEKKLICYFPYGMPTISEIWTYNLRFHNIAWRIYFQTTANNQELRERSYIKGSNVRVVGDPIADRFLSKNSVDVWKVQNKKKKRIIWAPHYSIKGNQSGLLCRNSFDWLSEEMLRIASDYQDYVQFTFKPHPRLLHELCSAEGWGQKRADEYYDTWRNLPNTQLETGDYVDLFKTSDALIHDCASFTAEYQFTGNPALFVTNNIASQEAQLTPFGKMALGCHYIGTNVQEIRSFIDRVVIGNEDPNKQGRLNFRNNYLLPPGGLSSAENVYNDIVHSLRFKG